MMHKSYVDFLAPDFQILSDHNKPYINGNIICDPGAN